MSASEIIIRIIGVVLAVVGLIALLAVMSTLAGVSFFGVGSVSNVFLALILGVVFLGAGIYIVRGGTITW